MLTVREWRLAKEISQQEMADRLGVHVNTYIAMEKEPEKIRIGQAVRISDIFGIPLSNIDFGATKCSVETTK